MDSEKNSRIPDTELNNMLFDDIVIDSANLFYRLKKESQNSLDITKKLIDFTENLITTNLKKDGNIWILFDPISFSDLGESKIFVHSLSRKQILPDYKANRKYSNLYLNTIELYRKYYLHKGEKYKLVYSETYEADDYVEPLLKKLENHKIALISTDLDFSRYINDNICLINKGFNDPFTVKEFINTFKFNPTKTSVTFYKALFGDTSDNIKGVIFTKKARFLCPHGGIKLLCLNFIKSIENEDLDEVITKWKKLTLKGCIENNEKSHMEELFIQIYQNDAKLDLTRILFNNIKVIRSQLENKKIDSFIHSNPYSAKHKIVHQSIYGMKFSNIFGKL